MDECSLAVTLPQCTPPWPSVLGWKGSIFYLWALFTGRLTAFNFEELCISSDYEKLYIYIYIYIYNVNKGIQLYIIYYIWYKGSLLGYFLE